MRNPIFYLLAFCSALSAQQDRTQKNNFDFNKQRCDCFVIKDKYTKSDRIKCKPIKLYMTRLMLNTVENIIVLQVYEKLPNPTTLKKGYLLDILFNDGSLLQLRSIETAHSEISGQIFIVSPEFIILSFHWEKLKTTPIKNIRLVNSKKMRWNQAISLSKQIKCLTESIGG